MANVCRRPGISSATFHKWKAKFGGLEISDARRLRALYCISIRTVRRTLSASPPQTRAASPADR